MRIVFIMDPVSTVRVDEDTSFALMLEAQARGDRVEHCLVQDVALDRGSVVATVRRASMTRDGATPIVLGEVELIALADVDAVFIRKDPPFDDAYLWLTLILEHLRGKTVMVNDPRGLREANEKLYAMNFPEVIPPTLVSSDKAAIRRFVTEVGGKAVIKPVDGHGGEGVFALTISDLNFNALIESVTRHGQRVAMVQQFLPEVAQGDKRILLVKGEPIGAINRIPTGGDLRGNIHAGGRVELAKITATDRVIIDTIAPRLRSDGLVFVGIDVIGKKLTEINVTSPTGMQQMRLRGHALGKILE